MTTQPISDQHMQQITNAQNLWTKGIVTTGKDYLEKKNYVRTAKQNIINLYAYHLPNQKVFFKPTRSTIAAPFRNTAESALAYFVGNHPDFPEDTGFALEPWTDIEFKNIDAGIIHSELILVVGQYVCTNLKNQKFTAEYTFGYKTDKTDKTLNHVTQNLKIVLHHSSFPFFNV